MEDILRVLTIVLSWPVVFFIVIMVFSKQLKLLFEAIIRRKASLKLPGNIEFSLDEFHDHPSNSYVSENDKQFVEAASQAIAELPDKSTDTIKKTIDEIILDYKKADVQLYLKTVSFQLISWLFAHRNDESFSLTNLLEEKSIPIEYNGNKVGAYCIHSNYEKDAVAVEFKRNFWNFQRFEIIELINKSKFKVVQDNIVLEALAEAMNQVYSVEKERRAISISRQKFSKAAESETKA